MASIVEVRIVLEIEPRILQNFANLVRASEILVAFLPFTVHAVQTPIAERRRAVLHKNDRARQSPDTAFPNANQWHSEQELMPSTSDYQRLPSRVQSERISLYLYAPAGWTRRVLEARLNVGATEISALSVHCWLHVPAAQEVIRTTGQAQAGLIWCFGRRLPGEDRLVRELLQDLEL